jgi:DNA-binding response OmpR family regulator
LLRVAIVSSERHQVEKLHYQLSEQGIQCRIGPAVDAIEVDLAKDAPDLVLAVIDDWPESPGNLYLAQKAGQAGQVPVISLVTHEALDMIDAGYPVDDFVIAPWDPTEVLIRIKRALRRVRGLGRGQSIMSGDLVIDLDNCEVTLQGKVVTLTFKEYELLKFLAGNKGRVFSREALLDEVWGYDYFGGDRTVDVHVRRLRSKIEAPTRTFIETVRNIGYRFRKDA